MLVQFILALALGRHSAHPRSVGASSRHCGGEAAWPSFHQDLPRGSNWGLNLLPRCLSWGCLLDLHTCGFLAQPVLCQTKSRQFLRDTHTAAFRRQTQVGAVMPLGGCGEGSEVKALASHMAK